MDKKQYTKEIWKRIRERIVTRYGAKRTALISLITPVIVNGIAYYVLFRLWGADTANQEIVAFFIGTVLLEATLLGMFLISWRFYDVPEEIYKEQKEQIDELQPEKNIVVEVYTNFLRTRVGLDIKNLTLDEDFSGVIELISLNIYSLDEHCDENKWSDPVDISNSHFEMPVIKRNDHQVVYLAELLEKTVIGNKIIFLTENKIPMMIEFFIVRPAPIQEPSFVKIFFELEFEVRGKLKNTLFTDKYTTLITLRANVLSKTGNDMMGSRLIDANIGIGEVEYVHKSQQTT